MIYPSSFISDEMVPHTGNTVFQHVVDTYASEANKTASVWNEFRDEDLGWRPHSKSATVGEIMRHELLSERRFFAEFLGAAEPDAVTILPEERTVAALIRRLVQLSTRRFGWLASLDQEQWLERRKFFDVERERVWIFWRRVLHTAHHRTQLTVYLRLLDRPVPATYGPTADKTWDGADPTTTVAAAQRQSV